MQIGPTEYRLLHFFMTHPERVYTRTQLLDHVWGGSVYVEERTVDVHIRRLRKTLEPHRLDGMVQTVRGAGYRFSASVRLKRARIGSMTSASSHRLVIRDAVTFATVVCRRPRPMSRSLAHDAATQPLTQSTAMPPRARSAWFRTLGQLALVLVVAAAGRAADRAALAGAHARPRWASSPGTTGGCAACCCA